MGANASDEYDTGPDVIVPTVGRRGWTSATAVSLATGLCPLRITTVSPACTSRINLERCVLAS